MEGPLFFRAALQFKERQSLRRGGAWSKVPVQYIHSASTSAKKKKNLQCISRCQSPEVLMTH